MYRKLILILLINFISICITSEKLWACNINLRVSSTRPFYIQQKSVGWTGLSVELGRVLLEEAGCKAFHEKIGWARSLELMRDGNLDMMTNLSITKDRKEFIYFIGPQMDETVILVIRRDIDTNIQSLDDFKKLPGEIGRQRGAYRGDAFMEKLKSDAAFADKFEISYSSELNRRKMIAGRIIGSISELYSAKYHLKKPEFKNFKIVPYIIHQDWVYFGFSKKSISSGQLSRFQNAYNKAKTKGAFELILNKYK